MRVLIICGPTASGKNNLAYKILDKYAGEIVNADSRQVYKYFDIGTNKGNLKNKNEHVVLEDKYIGHLYDFLEPSESFSIYEYQKLAEDKIQEILNKNFLPIIVGGTGLYIDSLVKGYVLDENKTNIREELNKLNLKELLELIKMENINIDHLNNSDRNNPVRLIRLIEKSRQGNSSQKPRGPRYEYTMFYPEFDREELYKKINERVEKMFEEGLIDEVKNLKERGFENTKPFQGIGYLEINRYLNNEIDINEAKELIKISHRNYAKRQITWFEGENRGYDLIRVNTENILERIGSRD